MSSNQVEVWDRVCGGGGETCLCLKSLTLAGVSSVVRAPLAQWARYAAGGSFPTFESDDAGSPLERLRKNRPLLDHAGVKRIVTLLGSVGRVLDHERDGKGSAISFSGADLHPVLKNERVVITCAHVLQGLISTEIEIEFQAFDRHPRIYDAELIWESSCDRCDVAVLRLRQKSVFKRYIWSVWPPRLRLAMALPRTKTPIPSGHLRNTTVHIAGMLKEGVLAIDVAPVPYRGAAPGRGRAAPLLIGHRCETAGGASGSALLDEAGRVIGVHRSGKHTKEDGYTPDPDAPDENVAVAITSIRDAFTEDHSN